MNTQLWSFQIKVMLTILPHGICLFLEWVGGVWIHSVQCDQMLLGATYEDDIQPLWISSSSVKVGIIGHWRGWSVGGGGFRACAEMTSAPSEPLWPWLTISNISVRTDYQKVSPTSSSSTTHPVRSPRGGRSLGSVMLWQWPGRLNVQDWTDIL